MEKLQKWYSWIVILLIIVVHFFFLAGAFGDFNIQNIITDPYAIIHLVFTTASSVIMTGVGADKGIERGLETPEFQKADKLNNETNLKIQPHRRAFNLYIRTLNQESKEEVQENFLMEHGVLSERELTKKQLKKFKKLKYVKYDTSNAILPLFYEQTRGNKVKIEATFDPKAHKRKGMIKKAFLGVLTSALTVDLIFNFKNFGDAFATILMVVSSLILVYTLHLMPPIYKLKQELPNKVINKFTLWQGFEGRKDEMYELLKVEQDKILKEMEQEKQQILYLP